MRVCFRAAIGKFIFLWYFVKIKVADWNLKGAIKTLWNKGSWNPFMGFSPIGTHKFWGDRLLKLTFSRNITILKVRNVINSILFLDNWPGITFMMWIGSCSLASVSYWSNSNGNELVTWQFYATYGIHIEQYRVFLKKCNLLPHPSQSRSRD